MRPTFTALCALTSLSALAACSAPPERELTPGEAATGEAGAELGAAAGEARAREALRATAAAACAPSSCVVSNLTRTPLRGDVVEYSVEIKVGPGEFDRIGLHRVAREKAPWQPVVAKNGVFLVHGDAWPFNPVFVGGAPKAPAPRDEAAALYFAERGIDVWGIDRRWAQSPAGTTDFEFMRNWTFDVQVKDIGVGLGVARALRALTGSGAGPMNLLGFSRGAALTYAYANAETQVPAALRQVKGIVPVDYAYKFDPADPDNLGAVSCENHQVLLDLLDLGYVGFSNRIYSRIGDLAEADPDGASPFDPSLTNEHLALSAFIVEAPQPTAFTPYYHLFGARRVEPGGSEFELLYTDHADYFDFLQSIAPVESLIDSIDGAAIGCDAIDTPYDDHLGAIKVPVFYVGAAGGFGDPGLYTLGLLGSADKSSVMVQVRPDGEELLDYGHEDLFTGRDARELAWRPVADWLLAH